MDFKIIFTVYDKNADTLTAIREGNERYDVWGIMDIKINGISFFHKYQNHNPNGPMGSSSMGISGLTVPIFGFISSFLYLFNKIGVQKVEIEDDQIDKELVVIPKEDKVKFAIINDPIIEGINWYDGNQVLLSSNDFPINTLNCVPTKEFKKAAKEGILEYLYSLLNRYPELDKVEEFRQINKYKSGYLKGSISTHFNSLTKFSPN